MFLDTTVFVEVLTGNREVINYVENVAESEPLFLSIVQLGEIADWCHSNNINSSKVLDEVRSMATVVGLTDSICIEGSKIKQKQRKAGKSKFSLIDGFIVASAMNFEQKLLTADKDFEALENVIIL